MAQVENEAFDRIKQLYKKVDASMILFPVFLNVFLVVGGACLSLTDFSSLFRMNVLCCLYFHL